MYAGNLPALLVSDVDLIKQICIKDFSKFPNRIVCIQSHFNLFVWNKHVDIKFSAHDAFLE